VYVISNIFMPSLSQSAKIVLPCLHAGTALIQLRKFNTDADQQEVRAVEAITGPAERVTTNTHHGLCAQDRLDPNLVNDTKYKAIIVAAKDKSAAAQAKVDMILWWLW
jgi:hypothetical protein